MIQTNDLNPAAIRQRGLDALLQALGPVGMVRFLQQFDPGYGDYAHDRSQWLAEISLEDAIAQVKQNRHV